MGTNKLRTKFCGCDSTLNKPRSSKLRTNNESSTKKLQFVYLNSKLWLSNSYGTNGTSYNFPKRKLPKQKEKKNDPEGSFNQNYQKEHLL